MLVQETSKENLLAVRTFSIVCPLIVSAFNPLTYTGIKSKLQLKFNNYNPWSPLVSPKHNKHKSVYLEPFCFHHNVCKKKVKINKKKERLQAVDKHFKEWEENLSNKKAKCKNSEEKLAKNVLLWYEWMWKLNVLVYFERTILSYMIHKAHGVPCTTYFTTTINSIQNIMPLWKQIQP